jgi:pimeloyl-ACP methyl ester carboxylesterase
MTFVFLHGGPGFNGFAERAILGPLFQSSGHEATFWNEPSPLRPDGEPFEAVRAFERWLISAERFVLRSAASGPVHLIAHSMSVHAAMQVARQHPHRIESLVLVAPAADPFVTYRSVLKLAYEDLVDVNPEIASRLADSIARTRSVFDDAMCQGLNDVLHDERLFTHYWADPRQMEIAMALRDRPEAQFDAESFFAVLTDFAQRGTALLSPAPVTVPTLAMFGKHDRVTAIDEQRSSLRIGAPNARVDVLDACSHYLHLDRPQAFVDIVVSWAGGVNRVPLG